MVKAFSGRPRFGSVTVWEGNGSSGSGFRFWRFLCKEGFSSVFQYSLTGKNGSSSGFVSWKTVPAVPVSAFGFGENGSDGSGFRFPVRFLSHLAFCQPIGGAELRWDHLYFGGLFWGGSGVWVFGNLR